MTTFDIYFNYGTENENHYTTGDNVSLIEITNSDNEYYQNGIVELFNVTYSQQIGDDVRIYINDSLQFNGKVSARYRTVKGGVKTWKYQLVGKTYDLWRYATDENAIYSGMTGYIASSLINAYAPGISASTDFTNQGIELTQDTDFTYQQVGDAIASLTNLDGYRFYVDLNGNLVYYRPEDATYTFTVTESDLIDLQNIEESDTELINDCLVEGGTGYSNITNVSQDGTGSKVIPSGVLVAQSFTANDERLTAVDLYLDRSTDPNQPDPLSFEIWQDKDRIVFEDNFSNSSNIASFDQTEISDGVLHLEGTQYKEKCTPDAWHPTTNERGHAQTFKFSTDIVLTESRLMYNSVSNGLKVRIFICPTGSSGEPNTSTKLADSGEISIPDGITTQKIEWSDPPLLEANKQYACVSWRIWGNGGVHKLSQAFTDAYSKGKPWYYDGSNWNEDPDAEDLWFIQIGYDYKDSGNATSTTFSPYARYLNLNASTTNLPDYIWISGTVNGGSNWVLLNTDGKWVSANDDGNQIILKYYLEKGPSGQTPQLDYVFLRCAESGSNIENAYLNDCSDFTECSSSSNIISIPYVDNEYYYKLSGSIKQHYSGGGASPSYTSTLYSDVAQEFVPDLGVASAQLEQIRVGEIHTSQRNKSFVLNIYPSNSSGYPDTGNLLYTSTVSNTLGSKTFYPWKDNFYMENNKTYWLVLSRADGGGFQYRRWTASLPDEFRMTRIQDGQSSWESFLNEKFYTLHIYLKTYSNGYGYISSNSYTVPAFQVLKADADINGDISISGTNFTDTVSLTNHEYHDFGTKAASGAVSFHFSTNNIIQTPYMKSYTVTLANTTTGGGQPDSGGKIEWSDDIVINANQVPYNPSSTGWLSYSDPKLQLTSGNTYWIILEYPSSNSKWWAYYYDSNSTYNGKIMYSWDNGVNWSSNSSDPADIPSGNMRFKLGWKQGSITARASNQTSINQFGRYFKKISEPSYSTYEQALARAQWEVSGSESIIKNGTMVIEGRTDISTNYRFSANLPNYGINEGFDIRSYTQRIDKNGFTTTINFGKHPFDLAAQVAKNTKDIESEA